MRSASWLASSAWDGGACLWVQASPMPHGHGAGSSTLSSDRDPDEHGSGTLDHLGAAAPGRSSRFCLWGLTLSTSPVNPGQEGRDLGGVPGGDRSEMTSSRRYGPALSTVHTLVHETEWGDGGGVSGLYWVTRKDIEPRHGACSLNCGD